MKQFDVITIFPPILDSYINESLFKRAQKNKILKIKMHNLRQWTADRHQTVDDKPYGGGVGLVFKIEPIFKAVRDVILSQGSGRRSGGKIKSRVILFSPRGKKFTQADAKRLAKYGQLIFICGRYEGVDERVAEHLADEVISIGDYVLSGGELPAMVVMEATSRHIKGVVGKEESVAKADHPQYTRPEVFNKWKVPKVLLSGNHAEIEKFRKK